MQENLQQNQDHWGIKAQQVDPYTHVREETEHAVIQAHLILDKLAFLQFQHRGFEKHKLEHPPYVLHD